MNALLRLGSADLRALEEALRSGRLTAPFLPALIERIVPRGMSAEVSGALQAMAAGGANREGVVLAVGLLAASRAGQPAIDELVDLVTTGPEAGPVTNRDTRVVVQELFRHAETTVLVAGYELYQAVPVFRTLAERMAAAPGLRVRMLLNVKRPVGDTREDRDVIAAFGQRFRREHWPPDMPLPEIYFDPRSLALDGRRAVLHAKCVAVDGRTAFVSSANFTEAAQERNIEVGVLIRSEVVAARLVRFFDALTASGAVRRAV